MSRTTTNLLVHFIFGTRNRAPLINAEIERDLHAYLGGIVRQIRGVAISINGMTDHIHLLVRVPATHSVADIARLIKTNSSRWVHERWPQYREFGWQTGDGAFSVSESGVDAVKGYIARQKQHHAKMSFQDEFVAFLQEQYRSR
jgi:putative transposase